LKLLEKVALITGAGRGIGRAIACGFAREGARLVLTSRTTVELEQTLRLPDMTPGTVMIPTDVGDPVQVDTLFDQISRRFGRLDILVNCAAIQGPIGPLWQTELDHWRETINVNILGTMYCCRAAVALFLVAKKGKIINFAGGGATAARPNFSAYATSKAAIVRFTETLAEELRLNHVDVNAVAPGLVDTQMLDGIVEAGAAAGAEGAAVAALRNGDGGRLPTELPAQLAIFLASDASDGLTGRLISAPHDDWRNWDRARIEKLCSRPWLTLRRLDRHTLRLLAEN
jgi:NAD(P)-dependent dehydrogenase (short-subunit alcohol dehydrogenase family)